MTRGLDARGATTAVGVAVGLVALHWVQAAATPPDATDRLAIALAIAAALVVAALVGAAVSARRPVLAAGVLVAITPSALGLLSVVATAAVVAAVATGPLRRRGRFAALVPAAVVAALGAAAWWNATPARVEGAAPSIGDLLATTGVTLRRTVATVGSNGAPIPATAELVWWVAVGMIVAASALSRPRVAWVPVLGVALALGTTFALERWRGPADPSGGVWLIAGCLAFTASRVELARLPGRRVAAVVIGSTAWTLAVSTAADVRFASVDESFPPAWERWRSWASGNGSLDARWLLPITVLGGLALVAVAVVVARSTRDRAGVNVVGYHSITAGLGERARELSACLDAVGVPVARVDLDVDSERDAPRLPDPPVHYASTIVVAPAFEVPAIAERHPWAFGDRRMVAGYWFWELADVPESHLGGLDLVDEVWAPSRFVADAYGPATTKPVRSVPLPVAEPFVAPLGRAELGLGPDEFVVVTSFSHLSVMERKHPLGVVEAFRRAFPADAPDGRRCRLVVKSLNADRRPHDAARLAEAALGDDRIEIRPERVEHAELMALIAAADVLVSLHRSEGLGLHLAEAMWVGTTIVATDHSGSRDLLDRHCAELVPWRPVAVANGDGAYPDGATWAEPDLDAAAAALRRLAADPERRARLAAVAHDRITRQPDRRTAGRVLAKLARCPVPR